MISWPEWIATFTVKNRPRYTMEYQRNARPAPNSAQPSQNTMSASPIAADGTRVEARIPAVTARTMVIHKVRSVASSASTLSSRERLRKTRPASEIP